MIKIQKNDFNLENELIGIKILNSNIGAISTFVGYVRENNKNKLVKSIDLEVYKDMANKSLNLICEEAKQKWNLINTLIIHRYGHLKINEKIVLVATFAKHRNDSSNACSFIMDYLKKDAPFWKKEYYENDYEWLQNTNQKN